jgi:acetyltransferase-like isoleucine patch superfamily enzyme
VRIGAESIIGNHVVIHEGANIGARCFIDDGVRLGYDCQIGEDVRLMYRAYVCDRVVIEAGARVSGFVCDGAVIERGATMFGQLVHEYSSPDGSWWGPDEASPVVETESVVGMGAMVIGGVRIGRSSYVAAGAVVTKDVPAHSIVVERDVVTPSSDWRGQRLADWIDRRSERADEGLTS